MDSVVETFDPIYKFFAQVDASLAILFVVDCNLFGLGTILYHGYSYPSLGYWTLFTLLMLVGVISDIYYLGPPILEDHPYHLTALTDTITANIIGGIFLMKGKIFIELMNSKRKYVLDNF